jgi:hypothetical protein
MNTPRLLSLKMAAAIPGSNPSSSVNRVYMHLSHRTNFLQVRAVQSSVMVFYQTSAQVPVGPHRSVMLMLEPTRSFSLYQRQCRPIQSNLLHLAVLV